MAPRYTVDDMRTDAPNFSSCMEALLRVFDSLEEKDVLAVNIGGIRDISEMLLHSGWHQSDVDEVERFLKILRVRRVPNPLRRVVSELAQSDINKNVFICIISKRCVIASGAEGRFLQPTHNYEVAESLEGKKDDFISTLRNIPPRGIEPTYNAIQLTMQAETHRRLRALFFVAALHHEMRHLLDTSLISDWIIANRELINAGKSPSELFAKYVRILHPGKSTETIVVLRAFENAVLEPNAYLTSLQVSETLILHNSPADDVKNRKAYLGSLAAELKELAYGDVASLEGGKELLHDFKITEDTIFELGPRLEKNMRATIRRAARGRSPTPPLP